MGEAIRDMLPAAVGVAISPLPIIAVVLILVSPRGRVNGPAYLMGQVVGIAVVGGILLVIAGSAGAQDNGQPAGWVNWLKLVLGVALLVLALQQWRTRPRKGEEAETPAWMGAVDAFTPAKAAGVGAALATINPKNFILIVAGMVAIAQTGIPAGEQVLSLAVFVLIGSIGVATPVVIYFALGDRSQELLQRLKTWMAQNSSLIMAVVLLVIAAKLIGDAISGFSS